MQEIESIGGLKIEKATTEQPINRKVLTLANTKYNTIYELFCIEQHSAGFYFQSTQLCGFTQRRRLEYTPTKNVRQTKRRIKKITHAMLGCCSFFQRFSNCFKPLKVYHGMNNVIGRTEITLFRHKKVGNKRNHELKLKLQ